MHEHALMTDVIRKLEQLARESGAARVVAVDVQLGALSHFTPEHFREHFVDAARGTIAEGAAVRAVVSGEIDAATARDVVVEAVEVED